MWCNQYYKPTYYRLMNHTEFEKMCMELRSNTQIPQSENLDIKKWVAECTNLYTSFLGAQQKAQAALLNCDPKSFATCMIIVVRSPYLTFDKKQNSAYITPFGTMATISIGYSAYVKALRAHGVNVVVDAIYESEKFSVQMTERGYKLNHEKTCFKSDAPVKVWFALSFENTGFSQFLGMDNAEIEKRKKVAKTSFVWDAWKKEMSMKTVLLRLCNFYYRDLLSDLLTVDIDNEIDNKKAEMQAALTAQNPLQITQGLESEQEVTEIDIVEMLKSCETVEEVNTLFKSDKVKYNAFIPAFAARKNQILAAQIEKEEAELKAQTEAKESVIEPEPNEPETTELGPEPKTNDNLNPDLFSKLTEFELLKMIERAKDVATLASLKQDCIENFGAESVELNGTFYKALAERGNFFAVQKSQFYGK